MFGCFIGGWFADKRGRKAGVFLGICSCIFGAILMAASQNANMFVCARVITGIGTGFVLTIIPPWVSELARAHNRGASFALVFVSNCGSSNHHQVQKLIPIDVGIVISYWLNYGVKIRPLAKNSAGGSLSLSC